MKRLFDFTFALLGLVILSPIFIFISLLILFSSPGPVLYSQTRVGQNGRLFRLHKFRTMVVDADKMGTSVTTANDPRITPIGRLLRCTKLDELPQLWNVLVGEMSFVGPRPDVPDVIAMFSYEMDLVLRERPGITGLATLHLHNEEELLAVFDDPDLAYQEVFFPLKIELAKEQITRSNLAYDVWIILQTIWALTLGRIWPIPVHPLVKRLKDSSQSGEPLDIGSS